MASLHPPPCLPGLVPEPYGTKKPAWLSELEGPIEKETARSTQGEALFEASQTACLHTYAEMAVRARDERQRQSPDVCERCWVRTRLHLWLIMFNTLEASPPQLLPLHKSHTSGPLILHCWMLRWQGRTHAEKAEPICVDSEVQPVAQHSFITAQVDIYPYVLCLHV